jgi:transposase
MKEQILALAAEGKSYRQIQATLNCSKGTIAYHLGQGQREKTNARTVRSRTLAKRKLWDYKESLGCKDCQEMYPHYMLDFDHLPEFEKVDSPTQLVHKYSWDKALEEVAKCDVVCGNCHKIRTWQRYIDSLPEDVLE